MNEGNKIKRIWISSSYTIYVEILLPKQESKPFIFSSEKHTIVYYREGY